MIVGEGYTSILVKYNCKSTFLNISFCSSEQITLRNVLEMKICAVFNL